MPLASETPSSIGRYELLGVLGSGGMATVHLARLRAEQGFERLFAVKCCHPHLDEDESFAKMFLDEARLAARLHHPNVVPTLDFGSESGRTFLVMDYVEGVRALDLLRLVNKEGEVMPVAVALKIVVDTLAGLHAAHELTSPDGAPLGVVHRDMSPHNILVGIDGVSRVIDFGVAKAAERASVTQEGMLKGKIAYMAPEQLCGEPVDRRTDLFAVGIVLWELLAGRRLFAAPSREEMIKRLLEEPIAFSSELRPDVPAALDAVVTRALARTAAHRYESAQAFSDAIEATGAHIATTREVGRYVEERFGTEVRERRRVADLSSRSESGRAVGRPGSSAAVAQAAPATMPSRRRAWLVLAAAVLAVTGPAVWWLHHARERTAPVVATELSVPPPTPEALSGPAPIVAASEEAEPEPAEPPTADRDRPRVRTRGGARRGDEAEPRGAAEAEGPASGETRTGRNWFPAGP